MPFNSTTSFLPWVQLSRLVAQIGFFSSSFFCYIFISLTLYGMKKRFGSYTYLLVTFSTVGIVFASFEFVLYPNVHSYNAGYFFYTTSNLFGIGKNAVTWCLSAYTGIYASTISMLSVQFIYRYWAIFQLSKSLFYQLSISCFSQQKLRMFKGLWVVPWILYCSIFGILWALGVYFFNEVDDYAESYLEKIIKEGYDIRINEVSGQAMVAYSADGSLRYRNLFGAINMSSIVAVQYVVIIYCAVMMNKNMEEKLQMVSEAKRTLHKQFFKTLVLQIVTPTVTLFSPIIFIIYLPFLDIKVNIPTGVFLSAISLYPAMDAIIIMSIVTDYRKTGRSLLLELFGFESRCLSGIVKKALDDVYAWFRFSEEDNVTKNATEHELSSVC